MSTSVVETAWPRVPLGKLATVSRGASPRPIASSRWFSDDSVVGWVRISDLGRSDGLTLKATTQRLSPEGIVRSRFLPPGTLIMSIAATVGVPIVTGIPACIHDGFVAIENLRKVDREYLLYTLKSLQDVLRSAGQTGSQANVNSDIVKGLPIPLPPVSEQKAIADALLDADHFIAKLERLIAKKQAIKQGMMQHLLSGRTRLPGFTAPWREAPLAEVSTMKGRIGWQGLTQAEFTSDARQPFLITGMNFKDGEIRWREVYHVSEERYAIAPEIQLKADDVLMTKDGTIGKLLYVDAIPSPGKATLNSHLLVFRPKNNAYFPRFLYYQLASPRFAEHIELHKSGTTFFGISQGSVGKYQMMLPPVHEQIAIAHALRDMDVEIEALNTRLEKSRNIKVGMMQRLLTGRTRLPMGTAP